MEMEYVLVDTIEGDQRTSNGAGLTLGRKGQGHRLGYLDANVVAGEGLYGVADVAEQRDRTRQPWKKSLFPIYDNLYLQLLDRMGIAISESIPGTLL